MIGKNTLTRIVIVTAVVAVVSLAIAGLIGFTAGGFDPRQAGRPGLSVDQRKTLDLVGVELLSISSVGEEVRIVEGQSGSVEAWLHGTVSAEDRDAMPRLEAARNGTTAEITAERERRFGFGPLWSNLVLEVSVPKGYAGRLTAKTVSADIEAGALSGDTTVHTTSGDVRVSFSAMPARLEASSTSGTITLRLPADAGFTLDARSTSGDISCKFPITVSESQTGGGRHALHGVVQAGAGKVLAHTVSGDIRIER